MGWLSKALGSVLSVIGLGSDDSAAKAQQAQLEAMKQKQALDASNEANNVTQFDSNSDTDDTFTGSDGTNRRKQVAGRTSSALGLGV